MHIFGGKITTYRLLSEHVVEKIESVIGKKGPGWTSGATLPGGDFPATGYDEEVRKLQSDYPFLKSAQAARLVRLYGTRAWLLLKDAKFAADLGPSFGPDLTASEIDYLVKNEWARTADDVMWRRTKAGLAMDKAAQASLKAYLEM